MKKEMVARELVSIAKELTALNRRADYGDTEMFVNVFDIFRVPPDAEGQIGDNVVPDLMSAVSAALLDEQRETVRRMLPRLKRNGVVQKHMRDWGVTFK